LRSGNVGESAAGRLCIRGRALVFEALTNDEVVVEDIEVQYAGLRAPWEKLSPPRPFSPNP
jgi:hypothetical protein